MVKRAGAKANVSPSTLDAIILKLEAVLKQAEPKLQTVVRRGLRRARFDGLVL